MAAVAQSLLFAGGSQSIIFEPLNNQPFGAPPFSLQATATSGLAVTFTSNTASVCTVSGNTAKLVKPGFCSLTASQPGGAGYNAATPVTRSIDVTAAVSPSGTLITDPDDPFAYSGTVMAVADFNGDGFLDFATTNANQVSVMLGNGSGNFTAAPGSPFAGTSLYSAVAGDFNGDGIEDLAVVSSAGVTAMLGDGTGRFTTIPGSPFATGAAPISVAVGDFNGDGNLDIVTANERANNVTVLLGNGAGGFTAAPGSPFTVGTSPYSVVVADFNGDGHPDIATANYTTHNVTVLLGNGAGAFAADPGSPFAVGTSPTSLTVSDFNGDGSPDLAVANYGSYSVTVLLGSHSGGFTVASTTPVAEPYSVVAGDFNGDGIPDLATGDFAGIAVTVLLGNGSGGFTEAPGSPFVGAPTLSQWPPLFEGVGDFNGDGRLDLATSNGVVLLGASASTSSVLSTTSPSPTTADKPVPLTLTVADAVTAFNAPTGTATFYDGLTVLGMASQSPWTFTIPGLSLSVGSHTLSATYNGDSRSLGSASNSLMIQVNAALPSQTIAFGPLSNQKLNESPLPLSATASSGLPVSFASNTPQVCTVSGNTSTGFSVTLIESGTCSITATQPGNSSYAPATPVTQTFTIPGVSQTIVFEPLNNQPIGTPPFTLKATATSGAAVTFTSNTTPVCTVSGNTATLVKTGFCSITASQAGSDGGYGAAAPVTRSFDVIAAVTPSGTLVQAPGGPFPYGSTPMAVADFNGDGILDLASVTAVLLGNGAGGFSPAPGSPFAGLGNNVVAADFNGDGIEDLAGATGGGVAVMLGDGSGRFAAAPGSPFAAGTTPVSAAVGDFNGDGILDIAAANNGSSNVTVLLGNGSGGFTAGGTFPAASSPNSVVVGDFNGDGVADIATAGASGVTVLLGNGSGGFTSAPQTALVGSSLAVGDFNGDGIDDLTWTFTVYSGSPEVNNGAYYYVTVLQGSRSGVFTGNSFPLGSVTFPISCIYPHADCTIPQPLNLVVGDFNGDGFQDIGVAIANTYTNQLTIMLGNGSGGFTAGGTFAGGGYPYAVAAGDFNGDGRLDLATSTGVVYLGASVPINLVLSTTSPLTITADKSVPLTLNINGGGYGVLTGTVTFYDGATVLGTANQSPWVFTIPGLSLSVGSHTLSATYTGSLGNSTSNSITIQVNPALPGQTIAFPPLSNQNLGEAPLPLTAFASSGLPVSLASNSPAVCTISGSTSSGFSVTLVAGGTCSITATQAGNGSYAAAAPVTRTFLVSVGPPAIVSLSPNAGSGTSVTFKAVYSDPNGAADLNELLLQVNTTQSGANACYLYYQPQGNHLYLANNAGNAWMTPALTPGVAGTASNSQCTLNAGSSSVTPAGNNLTLSVALSFASTFVSTRNVYLYAAGLSGRNSGWVAEGTWTPRPSAGPPSIVSLTPNAGTGNPVTFQAVYSDPNGAGDLSQVLLLVNTYLNPSAIDACFVYYQPQGNNLYLADNAGAWITPALTPGVAGTASNSQCTLDAGSSSVSMSGNNLTLSVALSFDRAVAGPRSVYLYASGLSGQNSPWIPEGTWTANPSAGPPVIVSLTPNSGTGASVTFQTVISDPNGTGDLSYVQLLVGTGAGTNACLVVYQQQGNLLYLFNNADTQEFPVTLGVPGTVSNSQCTLNAGSSSVTTAGNNLTLSLALTFSSWPGVKSVSLFATGLSGQNSGNPNVTEGVWAANPNAEIASISPSSVGAGSGTFTLTVNGFNFNESSVVYWYNVYDIGTPLTTVFVSATQLRATVPASDVATVGPSSVEVVNTTPSPTASNYEGFIISGPPTIVSLAPNTGAGSSVTFKAVYSDPNGAGDLNALLLQVNTVQSSANACYVYYQPQGNQLYLFNNGAWITPGLTPGVAGTVSNSQCTLNAGLSTVVTAGNNLTVNFALTFAEGFTGAKNVYLYASGFSGLSSEWVKEGTWEP